VTPSERGRRAAADLAELHGLTFYDAAYAATAAERDALLATAPTARCSRRGSANRPESSSSGSASEAISAYPPATGSVGRRWV
jgi:hypothetical protein